MTVDQKLDRILKEISNLAEQLLLMQAVLLELSSKPTSKGKGKRSIRTMQVVLDGCEDQTIEPSPGDGEDDSDDGGDGDKSTKPGIIRSKRGLSKKRR